MSKSVDLFTDENKTALDRDTLHGCCAACQRDARCCIDSQTNLNFKCRGWLVDEKKVAEILEGKT